MAKVALATWIAEAMVDPNKTGKCLGMTLVHRVGSSDQEVYSIQFGEAQWQPENLAKLFNNKADVHVQELNGSQLLFLHVFYEGSPEPQGRFSIRKQGGADQEQDVTEDATPKGQHQQVMRIGEAVMQTAIRQTQFLMHTQNEMIGMLSSQLRGAMTENAEAVKLVQQVILERAAQNHEFAMAEIKATSDLKMQGKLLSLGPALVNAMSGKEVFPQSTADESTMEALIDALSAKPQLLDILAKELPPEVLGLLAQRAVQHKAQENEARSLAEKALKSKNGAEDAAGN